MRAVRLQNPIRRIGSYSCIIQLDRDLKTEVGIEVLPDRTLDTVTAAAAAEEEAPAPEAAAEAPAPTTDADTKSAKGKKGAKG
jgi:hypothetical protein